LRSTLYLFCTFLFVVIVVYRFLYIYLVTDLYNGDV